MTSVLPVPHQVTWLVSGAGQPYEKFGGRYEAVVPALDPWRLAGPAGRHAPSLKARVRTC